MDAVRKPLTQRITQSLGALARRARAPRGTPRAQPSFDTTTTLPGVSWGLLVIERRRDEH